MAETAGGKVLEAVSKEAANDAKTKLEAAGAVVRGCLISDTIDPKRSPA